MGFLTREVKKGLWQTIADFLETGKWQPTQKEVDWKNVAKAAGIGIGVLTTGSNVAEKVTRARVVSAIAHVNKRKEK